VRRAHVGGTTTQVMATSRRGDIGGGKNPCGGVRKRTPRPVFDEPLGRVPWRRRVFLPTGQKDSQRPKATRPIYNNGAQMQTTPAPVLTHCQCRAAPRKREAPSLQKQEMDKRTTTDGRQRACLRHETDGGLFVAILGCSSAVLWRRDGSLHRLKLQATTVLDALQHDLDPASQSDLVLCRIAA